MTILDQIGEHLERLVAFDTVSSKSNLALIEYVAKRYASRDCDVLRIDDPNEDKANLIVTLGKLDQPPLVLSGHADVVPVEGQDWTHNPFALHRTAQRWYGRGACDMKGFLAVCLALFDYWLTSPPNIPVQLVISYDEEIGCQGVVSAVAHLAQAQYKPRLCIVGEPTQLHVVNQHKSKLMGVVRARGVAGHSSDPDTGVNAVQHAARILNVLTDLDAHPMTPGDTAFTPPRSTYHCGRFDGGVILNIIPEHAHFVFEIRGLPAFDLDELIEPIRTNVERENQAMQAKDQHAGIELEVVNRTDGLSLADDHPMTKVCMALTGDTQPLAVSYATEAGMFQRYGIDTLVLGPGNIAQAHRPDEWVDPRQLEQCYEILQRLADELHH